MMLAVGTLAAFNTDFIVVVVEGGVDGTAVVTAAGDTWEGSRG